MPNKLLTEFEINIWKALNKNLISYRDCTFLLNVLKTRNYSNEAAELKRDLFKCQSIDRGQAYRCQ